MTSKATRRFWKLYQELPEPIRRLAVKNYRLWRDNPRHPSLDFKKLGGRAERFSIRVGDHYRALDHKVGDGIEWVWIGTHGNTTNLWDNPLIDFTRNCGEGICSD
jgi:hypothetical protein